MIHPSRFVSALGGALILAAAACSTVHAQADNAPTNPSEATDSAASASAKRTHGEAGTIEAVTVYRGQALVTREVNLPQSAGEHEVVVTGLPARVVGGSVYAEAAPDSGVEVRSLRYRTRAVYEDTRKQVRELDDKIKQVKRDLKKNQASAEALDQQQELLGKLEKFTAPSAQWEIARGVLNAEVLQQITQFMFDQMQRIRQAKVEVKFAREDLEQKQEQLNRQRSKIAGASSQTQREAVVSVNDPQGGGSFRLRYLVRGATWSPSYNLRAKSGSKELNLEYLAKVRQTSGEDWDGVAMTLSTASPSLIAQPPKLTRFKVALTRKSSAAASFRKSAMKSKADYNQLQQQLAKSQQEVQQQRAQADEFRDGQSGGLFGSGNGGAAVAPVGGPSPHLDRKLNSISNQRSLLGILSQPVGSRRRGNQVERETRSVSVTYDLPQRTDLPSRNDQQLVRIASGSLKASVYRTAVPVLTDSVYREAKPTNTLDAVLLAGPTRSYLDGAFVGRGKLPTVAPGESFTVGLGVDPTLRAGRTLVDRNTAIQGGNRVITVDYRLTLSNFADKPRTVRLLDRLPSPAKGSDIRVELVSTSHDRAQAEGESEGREDDDAPRRLRWDVEVPAGATGDQAAEVGYTFRLSFDKQKTITGTEQ